MVVHQYLLQYANITPEQYYAVLNTENLKVGTEDIDSQLNLMKDENEKLLKGEDDVRVSMLDLHSKHIKYHRSITDDVELRKDPERLQAVLNHIREHYEMLLELSQTDPQLLMMIGEQPLYLQFRL